MIKRYPRVPNAAAIDNQWTDFFFKCIDQGFSGRTYKCLTCGLVFSADNGNELREAAVRHLRGNCKRSKYETCVS